MPYQVRIECRTGTRMLVDDRWQDRYHMLTWAEYDTWVEAQAVASAMLEDPREVRTAWIVEKPDSWWIN